MFAAIFLIFLHFSSGQDSDVAVIFYSMQAFITIFGYIFFKQSPFILLLLFEHYK